MRTSAYLVSWEYNKDLVRFVRDEWSAWDVLTVVRFVGRKPILRNRYGWPDEIKVEPRSSA